MRRLALLAVPLALLAACARDGRTLRAPSPDQTLSIVTVPTTTQALTPASTEAANAGDGSDGSDETTIAGDASTAVGEDGSTTLAADASTTVAGQDGSSTTGAATTAKGTPTVALKLPWADGARIPDRYTCNGANVSPAMSWTGVPAGTKELAIVVADQDSTPPGSTHWVVAGLPPTLFGVAEGTLPSGAVQALNGAGFEGWGGPCPYTGLHRFTFTVYALGAPSGVTAKQPSDTALAAIERVATATGTVVGTYGKA